MNYENILVEVNGGVVEVTLNNPDKFNALNTATAKEIIAVVKMVKRDPDMRAILLTGAGRGFCAGQDLSEIEGRGDNFSFREHLNNSYNPMAQAIRTLEKPVIAAINGACAGAGLGLALACDIRYASERAKFLTAFIGIGLAPDTGVSYWLPRLIGPANAAEMLFTNDRLDGTQAADAGLVNKVFPHETFLDEARALAQKLATSPTLGIGMTKRALNKSLGVTFDEQIDYETHLQEVAGHSEDYSEGVAAFNEKRKPVFKGH
ncbi:MAG: 2-(1,2-epoxy-1,2-dihydrophenyl)acetyl-CoA isomerase [Cellvibrionaceae bacterium]|jgi:2-(1,2-epoxy-1,2-dihydrophenyl)acetyl-CoA isomerase